TRIFSRREALAAGALLSSRLSLIIAASAIGLRLGLISEAMNAEILLVAVVTVTLGPLLFTRLLPPSEQIEPQPVIVIGAGQLGLEVANRIRTHNEPVYLVDLDQDQVSAAIRRGFEAQVGDLENPDKTLVKKLDQAKALICTYTDPELSYKVCSLARSVFGIDAVVADVPSPNDIPRFEQLDVTPVNAALDRATLLELHVRNPDMYMLLTRLKDSKEVVEIDCNNPACAGKALRQLSFPGDVLALALRRHGELIVPHGDTRIELGDHLTLVGSQDCIDEARSLFAI
ncbi:MAG TPA: NAD-binding protein, partial [Anaerolineales bacterium]